jgi:hypothetical protein
MRATFPGAGSLPGDRHGPPGTEKQPASSRTALRLLRECGALQAGKSARLEQRRARQARSRKSYAFWIAVATELEKLAKEPDLASVTRPKKDDEPGREAGQI